MNMYVISDCLMNQKHISVRMTLLGLKTSHPCRYVTFYDVNSSSDAVAVSLVAMAVFGNINNLFKRGRHPETAYQVLASGLYLAGSL